MKNHSLLFNGVSYQVHENETVLESLERGGVSISSSCRSGVCQSCLLKTKTQPFPTHAQIGLSSSQKEEGYFLACLCKPQQNMELNLADHCYSEKKQMRILKIVKLTENIAQVSFSRPEGFAFKAGQFLTFTREDGLSRSYSIASQTSDENHIEIHVKKIPDGQMSEWFFHEARVGSELLVSPSKGECYYRSEFENTPLVFVGTGTGMAPLWAIIQDAVVKNHAASIYLFEGALTADGLYLREKIESFIKKQAQLKYFPCVLHSSVVRDFSVYQGDISVLLFENFNTFKDAKFFLCGDSALVLSLKKKLFLKGIKLSDIFSDPFVASQVVNKK